MTTTVLPTHVSITVANVILSGKAMKDVDRSTLIRLRVVRDIITPYGGEQLAPSYNGITPVLYSGNARSIRVGAFLNKDR